MMRTRRLRLVATVVSMIPGLALFGAICEAEGREELTPLLLAQGQPAETSVQELREKLNRVQAGMREMGRAGRDPMAVRRLLLQFNELMKERKRGQAEAVLEQALEMIGDARGDEKPSAGRGFAPRVRSPAELSLVRPRPSGEEIEGLIAYGDMDKQRRQQIFIVEGRADNRRQLTHDADGNWMPDISPDGTRVVYAARPPRKGMEIRVIDIDGSHRKSLTTGGGGNISFAPAWSPDGKKIAYMSGTCRQDPKSCVTHIWVMEADGSNKRQLTSGDEADATPSWSPDGTKIAFFSHRDGGLAQIWVMGSGAGENPKRLTKAYHDKTLNAPIEQKMPAWSPDGRQIAYWRGVEMYDPRPTGEVPRDIWVMNADGSDQRLVVSGDAPEWSPDGKTLIFPINRPSEQTDLPIGVGAIDVDGSNRRVLFYCYGTFAQASWRNPVVPSN